MSTVPAFPNYLQIQSRLPLRAWQVIRIASLTFALSVVVLLFVRPNAGLTLWWGFIIPLLPISWLVTPGLWRNVCPMATLNQTPRVLSFTRGLTVPKHYKEYGYVIAIALFLGIVPARKALFNTNGPAVALLMLAALTAAFLGGFIFKGKSGWCSSICPLLPVQRIYGQTPFITLRNTHCNPCVGCTTNCYDFSPHVAYLSDLYDDDRYFSSYRKFFIGVFPGFILAFYKVSNPPAISVPYMYLQFAGYALISAGLFFLFTSFAKVTPNKITALYGAAALNIYYWFNIPIIGRHLADPFDAKAAPDAAVWAARAVVLGLTLLWAYRTYRKEPIFVAERGPDLDLALVRQAGGKATPAPAGSGGAPAVLVVPGDKRLPATAGHSLLEIAEAGGLRIEAGCRMGVCGADPIAIVSGMENLSPMRGEERTTLERLGLAENTRLACCARVQGPVSMSLTPERPKVPTTSMIAGFSFDRSIEHVVIIGNGIAGITAADHVRRRHPLTAIDVVGREQHHLYNRMGIERLIYGRSAMQGLYLLPDSWYDDYNITTWLNTRAMKIDREQRTVNLATGEALPYDRLILAMGSQSTVPPITGYGLKGTFVLREAEDAIAIRAYAQANGCRNAVVAGGGLLGLEAAHALHKLGLNTLVLERGEWLLRRQLDRRGGQFLREHLEGIGLGIAQQSEAAELRGQERVQEIQLRDGQTLPCDLFIVAAGITPNVELARAAGLTVNRGVVVDDHMRTSDPNVYAAGDVAEFEGQVQGLWPTAVAQAEVAAVNIAGKEKRFEDTVPVTLLKVVGIDLTSVGRYERKSADDLAIAEIGKLDTGRSYRRLLINRGHIEGAILLGYPLDAPAVTAAIRQHIDVSSCLEDLQAGDWSGLAALTAEA